MGRMVDNSLVLRGDPVSYFDAFGLFLSRYHESQLKPRKRASVLQYLLIVKPTSAQMTVSSMAEFLNSSCERCDPVNRNDTESQRRYE